MPASELGSNIRAVAYELRETNKKTASEVRRAVRLAIAKQAESTTAAIKDAALAQGMSQAAKATRSKVSFNVRNGNARIVTDHNRAPYARPLERGSEGSGGDYNRHPVFGRNVYVNQPTRPYFISTARAMEPYNEAVLSAAMDDALIVAGWSGVVRANAQAAVTAKYKATAGYRRKVRARQQAIGRGQRRGVAAVRALHL